MIMQIILLLSGYYVSKGIESVIGVKAPYLYDEEILTLIENELTGIDLVNYQLNTYQIMHRDNHIRYRDKTNIKILKEGSQTIPIAIRTRLLYLALLERNAREQ
jgi:hypothetical protein